MFKWSALLIISLSAFDLESTSNEVAPPGDGLTVTLDKHDGSIVFHNSGRHSIFILKPLDGSVDCIQIPYYRFTVRDPKGKPVQGKPRMCNFCGIWADTKWPQDYLVEIKPGASYSVETGWSWYYQIKHDGPHRISFEYVYEPTESRGLPPPPQAWRGTVAAPDIVMNLKKE